MWKKKNVWCWSWTLFWPRQSSETTKQHENRVRIELTQYLSRFSIALGCFLLFTMLKTTTRPTWHTLKQRVYFFFFFFFYLNFNYKEENIYTMVWNILWLLLMIIMILISIWPVWNQTLLKNIVITIKQTSQNLSDEKKNQKSVPWDRLPRGLYSLRIAARKWPTLQQRMLDPANGKLTL